MSADPAVRICSRCGHLHIGVPIQPTAQGLFFCTRCGTYRLVRELGEMNGPHERADPDEWGMGWH